MLYLIRSVGFVCVCLCAFACQSSKNLQYLQGSFDTTALSKFQLPDPVIQKGDILSIAVFSDNIKSSQPFNPGEQSTTQSMPGTTVEMATSSVNHSNSDYLVDLNGNITFPVIGAIKVEGLTKRQLTELLDQKLAKYLTNPYYSIRFMNFKITIIGEVVKPGIYSIPNERVNLLEAIGLAGDLTFFAKRENVLVIREINGKREFGRVDLRNPEIFKSPYYYLQQNDIVLVDMSKRKISANDQVAFRNVSLAATIVSALAVAFSVLRK